MNIIRKKVVCKFHWIRVERNNNDIRTEAEEINAFKCFAEKNNDLMAVTTTHRRSHV